MRNVVDTSSYMHGRTIFREMGVGSEAVRADEPGPDVGVALRKVYAFKSLYHIIHLVCTHALWLLVPPP